MTKNSKSKEIKLTNYELSNIQYDDYYYIEFDNIAYAMGYVPVTRLNRIRGKKDTFFVFRMDNKGYKVQKKTHNPALAEWSFYNAPMYDQIQEMFKMLNYKEPMVMDKKVNKKKLTKKERFESDPVLKAIYYADLRPDDNDSELTLTAKKNLSSIRPSDLDVIIIPE